jgi:hypothetical protein
MLRYGNVKNIQTSGTGSRDLILCKQLGLPKYFKPRTGSPVRIQTSSQPRLESKLQPIPVELGDSERQLVFQSVSQFEPVQIRK